MKNSPRKSLFILISLFTIVLATSLFISPKKSIAERKSYKKKTYSSKYKKIKNGKPINPEDLIKRSNASDIKKTLTEELQYNFGIDTVLLFDSSGSMKRTDPNRLRDQGGKLFLQFLDQDDQLAIFNFDAEVKRISSLKPITNITQQELRESISNIPDIGAFTDIYSAIKAAQMELSKNGRRKSKKCIVLLSDGKMDPHPSKGTSKELTDKLLKTELPRFKRIGIKIYTISLSQEADKELLKKIAHITDGEYFDADNINTVHTKFSELSLALKKPQIIELEENGFEIDSSIKEATFYISHNPYTPDLKIIDPLGNNFNNKNFPYNMKWFKSSLYDVVTIKKPIPGKWEVVGVDEANGFASLLTNLKLQVNWPYKLINNGDKIQIVARLTQNGLQVNEPGMDDITFFTIKIIDLKTSNIVESLSLNDKGELGDEQSDDGLHSRILEFNTKGQYKAIVTVTSPTFTRQQVIPFTVSKKMIFLDTVKENPKNEFFKVKITKKGSKLRRKRIRLVITNQKNNKSLAYDMRLLSKNEYTLPLSVIKKPSDYIIYAQLSGYDDREEYKTYISSKIPFLLAPEIKENLEEKNNNLEPEERRDKAESNSDLIIGLISTFISLISITIIGFFSFFRIKFKNEIPITPYVLEDSLKTLITSLKESSSSNKREPTKEELEILNLVYDSYKIEEESTEEKKEMEEAPSESLNDLDEINEIKTEDKEESELPEVTKPKEEPKQITPEEAEDIAAKMLEGQDI